MILVTGATGNVGAPLVRHLRARGLEVRPAVRRADEAGVILDFERPDTWDAALDGVSGVFLLRPPQIGRVRETLCAFADRAVARGVEQIVFLSVAGAEANRVIPHRTVEDHLRTMPIAWTLLRPGFFAQNLGDQYRLDILEDDRIVVPAGEGRAAFVDVRDVAEVAAAAFGDPSCAGQAWTLTGPMALGFDDVARLLSEALGREIRYEPASVVGYLRQLRRRGVGWGQAAVYTTLHVGLRYGQAERVDPTLERLLGRPPTELRTYIADHLDRWKR